MTAMEEELGSKADKTMIRNLETMVEKKVSEGYDAFSASVERQLIIIIFVYCRLTNATEQKILPQQAEISGIIVA